MELELRLTSFELLAYERELWVMSFRYGLLCKRKRQFNSKLPSSIEEGRFRKTYEVVFLNRGGAAGRACILIYQANTK